MTHTPGPWRRYKDKKGRVSKIEGRGRRVCTFQPSDLNAEANASLIAAAPEMLAILEELRESSTCCGTYDLLDETTWASPDLADRIESAIRKARDEA